MTQALSNAVGPVSAARPSDAELRDQAVAHLVKTTVGYVSTKTCKHSWTTPPPGTEWREALDLLAQIGT